MMILKKKMKIIAQLVIIFFSIPISCNGGGSAMNEEPVQHEKFSDVPDTKWEKLGEKSIYFGHQSVGFNILDGVEALMKEKKSIPLKIKEVQEPKTYEKGVITHSRIGENKDPESKLNGFVDLINSGGKKNADIMFFKFCYIDFSEDTDAKALFDKYQTAFEKIKKEHPNTQFIHMTAPLTTVQQGARAWVKRLIGKPIRGWKENIKRYEYNQLMRTAYGGKEPLVDIAAAESTYPDGSRSTYEADGKKYFSLIPEFTEDGGHLIGEGQKKVAEQLLLALANLV